MAPRAPSFPYPYRHSCVGRNPFGAPAPQTGRSPVSLDPQAPRHSRASGNLPPDRHSRVGGNDAPIGRDAAPSPLTPGASPFPRSGSLPSPRNLPPCSFGAHLRSKSAHSALTECSFGAQKALKRCSKSAHRPPDGALPSLSLSGAPTQPRVSRNPRTRRSRSSPSPRRSLNYDTRSLRPATPSAILTPMERSGRPAGQEEMTSNERF